MDVLVPAEKLREGDLLQVPAGIFPVHHAELEAGAIAVYGHGPDGKVSPIALHYRPGTEVPVLLRGAPWGAMLELEMDWDYYYNKTPGWAPPGAAGLAVGMEVTVTQHDGAVQWGGAISGHYHDRATGEYLLRSTVMCIRRICGVPPERHGKSLVAGITDMTIRPVTRRNG